MSEKKTVRFDVILITGKTVPLNRLFTENEIKDGKPRVIGHSIATHGAYFDTSTGSHVIIAPNQIERIVWFDSAEAEMKAKFELTTALRQSVTKG